MAQSSGKKRRSTRGATGTSSQRQPKPAAPKTPVTAPKAPAAPKVPAAPKPAETAPEADAASEATTAAPVEDARTRDSAKATARQQVKQMQAGKLVIEWGADDVIEDGAEPELVVEADRTRSILVTVGNIVATFLLVFVMFLCIDLGQNGNVWFFLVAVGALTAGWYTVKTFSTYGSRLLKKRPVMEFLPEDVVVYTGRNKKDVIPYAVIREAGLVREGHAVRLLLAGDWVTHPSGCYYVGIVYPFRAADLDGVSADVTACFARHKVRMRKNAQGK